jgi:hypothetical protein
MLTQYRRDRCCCCSRIFPFFRKVKIYISLGVSICLDRLTIETLNLEMVLKSVSTIEKISTFQKLSTFQTRGGQPTARGHFFALQTYVKYPSNLFRT